MPNPTQHQPHPQKIIADDGLITNAEAQQLQMWRSICHALIAGSQHSRIAQNKQLKRREIAELSKRERAVAGEREFHEAVNGAMKPHMKRARRNQVVKIVGSVFGLWAGAAMGNILIIGQAAASLGVVIAERPTTRRIARLYENCRTTLKRWKKGMVQYTELNDDVIRTDKDLKPDPTDTVATQQFYDNIENTWKTTNDSEVSRLLNEIDPVVRNKHLARFSAKYPNDNPYDHLVEMLRKDFIRPNNEAAHAEADLDALGNEFVPPTIISRLRQATRIRSNPKMRHFGADIDQTLAQSKSRIAQAIEFGIAVGASTFIIAVHMIPATVHAITSTDITQFFAGIIGIPYTQLAATALGSALALGTTQAVTDEYLMLPPAAQAGAEAIRIKRESVAADIDARWERESSIDGKIPETPMTLRDFTAHPASQKVASMLEEKLCEVANRIQQDERIQRFQPDQNGPEYVGLPKLIYGSLGDTLPSAFQGSEMGTALWVEGTLLAGQLEQLADKRAAGLALTPQELKTEKTTGQAVHRVKKHLQMDAPRGVRLETGTQPGVVPF